MQPSHRAPAVAAAALALAVSACGHNPMTASRTLTDRECMARAMYFESNRSSEEGMKAVGTVVMNRLQSGRYPGSVCGVVGQHNQFAPGVLSNPVSGRSWQLALAKADEVMAGERHARVGTAMHFHTAGYTFPYRNMAYVVAAGGNVFYDKKAPGTFSPVHPNVLVAEAQGTRTRNRPSEAIVLARTEEAAPIRRPEPVRFAARDERDERRTGIARLPARTALAQRDLDPPRIRDKPERIRLAHLEDEAMPKGLRQRSDVSAPFRLPETPAKAAASAKTGAPARGAASAAAIPIATGKRAAPLAEHGKAVGKAEAPPRPAAFSEPPRHPAAKAPQGQLLAYRDAKAKPALADAAAKAGWKRGPGPAAGPAPDKAKKRP